MPGVKKSYPLARRASGSPALPEKIKMDSRLRGNDVKGKKLDSGFRRNDELKRKRARNYSAEARSAASTGTTCASRPSARATRASLSAISTFPLAHNVA